MGVVDQVVFVGAALARSMLSVLSVQIARKSTMLNESHLC